MITVGGFNVSPPEIENYLLKYPGIANVAVVGVPDQRLGEVGAAFIVMNKGQKALEWDILDFCKDKISNVKIPRYIFFTDKLPLTPQGKVQKFKLREVALQKLNIEGE